MIQVEGLTKRYGPFLAVKEITFGVEKGTIVGFLGPNGAGKTTTMRILTCFMPPSSGRASIGGHDVLTHPMEVKKKIGYLPETPPLYPEMEVHEYLRFVAQLKQVPKPEWSKRVSEAAEKCAIGDVQKKLISKLSKGYRQRVGLAAALLHNPEVLILDEPTAGLDPKQIHETRDLIRGLAGDHTIILSTHILPEVEQTCDQVIIIKRGEIVAKDSVTNLTSRLRGQEAISVEISGAPAGDASAKIERVEGVTRVVTKEAKNGGLVLEVESAPGKNVRAPVARAVVESGWDLLELKSLAVSLEDVFLELTKSESQPAGGVQ
jgi:ABC-2 type transport system ATP-binding protein